MRGVMGITLVGGGVFLLIALFNGTIKFPLGQVNLLGSSTNIFGGSNPPIQVPQGKNPTAPKNANGRCPSGYSINPQARDVNAACIYTG